MVWQRLDGRSLATLRPVSFQRYYTKYSPGSVLVKFGETHVLCTASVSEDVPPFLMGTGQGWLTAEYRLLPGSTPKRQPRELTRVSGRTAEIQRLIGRSLRSVIDFQALGPRTITIDADVLQADGGTRTAAITGGFVALYDAITWLQGEGLVTASPIVHQIAAVSVGIVESTLLVDLCYQEDNRASVDMNVVMTAAGEFIEIQGTAEQRPFSLQQLQELLQLATHSIEELLILQNQALQLCEANRC
jgi:ribonuclease PH